MQITDLGKNEIGLTLTVPDKEKAGSTVIRTFHIVRTHKGAGTILASSQALKIPFRSALFSTYALGATDVPIATPSPSPSPTPVPGTSVKTSDDFNMPLWIGVLCALIIGFIGFNVYRRKKR